MSPVPPKPDTFPRCHECGHTWHGMPCTQTTPCICPTSFIDPQEPAA